MVDTVKLARMFRKANRILIKKVEGGLWVCDTYILIKLNPREESDFINKWNSYKSTRDIPSMENGSTFEISSVRNRIIEKDPIGNILANINMDQLLKINITELSHIKDNTPRRIFKCKAGIGLYNNKYQFLIDKMDIDNIKVKGLLNPLVLIKDEEVVGLIMPIRKKEGLLDKIKSIAS